MADECIKRPISHSVIQLFSPSVIQSFSYSVTQSLSHSVTQSFSQSVSRSVTHSLSHSVSHSVGQSLTQICCNGASNALLHHLTWLYSWSSLTLTLSSLNPNPNLIYHLAWLRSWTLRNLWPVAAPLFHSILHHKTPHFTRHVELTSSDCLRIWLKVL